MSLQLISSPQSSDASSALVFIGKSSAFNIANNSMVEKLSLDHSVYCLSDDFPTNDRVWDYVEALAQELETKKMKRLTIIGIDAGGSIAQGLAIVTAKLIRRLILINATTRLEPGMATVLIDWLEKFLPLGLPLRKLNKNFDSRPTLHRIHCPTLVVVQRSASVFLRRQSQYLAAKIPNAWLQTVDRIFDSNQFLEPVVQALITSFLEVPTKRPQKNLNPVAAPVAAP